MKIDIEVITGFLGSGKTSFINSLIEESQVKDERILVIQFEYGNQKLREESKIGLPIKVIKLKEVNELKNVLLYEIKEYYPNRIILEYNGTSNIESLFNILKEKPLKEKVFISTIFFIGDYNSINKYISNLGTFTIPFIKCANMIVINNIDDCSNLKESESIKKISSINSRAYLLKVPNKYELNNKLRKSKVLNNGLLRKVKVKIMNLKK